MRKLFIVDGTIAQGKKQCPWASAIALVVGGCLCFESLHEFNVWSNQI
jgi:hypothetical protein